MKKNNCLEMEITKNERTYRFLIPMGAPLGEVYDSAIAFAAEIAEYIKEHIEKSKPQEKKEESDKIVNIKNE